MITPQATTLLLTLPVAFAGGLGLGFVFFRALAITTDLIASGGPALFGLALTLGRLAVLAAGFYVAVLSGGVALLAALAGVLCAKALVLRRARRVGG